MKIGSSDISAAYIGSTAINKVYIGSTEVWSSMDADYAAILNYATTQGYTLPSASQQTLQNQLLVDLKTAGVWSKLDTFAVFATDGSSDFALIDWKRLTQYTAVNSPTFTTNQGFQGNGTSSYINSNYTPSTQAINYTSSNASFGVYWDKTTGTSGYLAGTRTGADANASYLNSLTLSTNSINSNITLNRDAYNQNYNFKQVQLISGNQYLYGDGSQDDILIVTGIPSLPPISYFILAFNSNGAAASPSNSQVRSFYAGASLLSESSGFNAALTTYYNSL